MSRYRPVPRPVYGYQGKTPARVLDLLETEGGWLTLQAMAMRLEVTAASAQTALHRLKERGLVESRSRPLAGADVWFEWRITDLALVVA